MQLNLIKIKEKLANLGVSSEIRKNQNHHSITIMDCHLSPVYEEHIIEYIRECCETLLPLGLQLKILRVACRLPRMRFVYDNYIKVETLNVGYCDLHVILSMKNDNGVYTEIMSHQCNIKTLALIANKCKELLKLPRPKMRRVTIELGEPHGFKQADQYVVGDASRPPYWNDTIERNSGLATKVRILGLKSIQENRKLGEISSPDTPAWFHVRCYNEKYKLSFDILTDGDGWYMIDSSKATPKTQRGKYLDLAELSNVDAEIINEAIRKYTEEFKV